MTGAGDAPGFPTKEVAGETVSVRFWAEWFEELPAGTAFAAGDPVAVGPAGRELVVSEVTERGKYAKGHEVSADVLVELEQGWLAPGATWLVTCRANRHYLGNTGWHTNYDYNGRLEHDAATVAEALDAVFAWAEELAAQRGIGRDQINTVDGVSGSARLATLNPGEGAAWARTLLRADFNEAGLDAFFDGLEAFSEEAERLYGWRRMCVGRLDGRENMCS